MAQAGLVPRPKPPSLFRKGFLLILLIVVVIFLLFYFSMSPNSSRLNNQRGPKGPLIYIDKPESNLHSDNHRRPQHGLREPMVMSLDYWEQFANALGHLSDLQCWANTVGINKVLEPYITPSSASSFHSPLRLPRQNSTLVLSDLVDLDAWNELSLRQSLSTVVPIETFLENATRDVLFVQNIFATKQTSARLQCRSMRQITKTSWYKYLTSQGFHIIDTLCIVLEKEPNHLLTAESFRDLIFRKNTSNVSLVFNIMPGLRTTIECDYRLCLPNTRCHHVLQTVHMAPQYNNVSTHLYTNKTTSIPFIPASLKVSNYVDQFKADFLSGGEYVAVMLRSEKLYIASSPKGREKCIDAIISDLKVMTNRSNLTTLFFSDASAHGSATLSSKKSYSFSRELEHSLNLKHQLKEVNQYLEKISGSKNSVLIATLEREIIARAKCVIIAGGGGFQRLTLHMYTHYHRGGELCYSFRMGTCESRFLD